MLIYLINKEKNLIIQKLNLFFMLLIWNNAHYQTHSTNNC
jgi:hypothetical protein